ncbi:MAG: glycosyltransferase family 2 protein [Pseudomonadota bacterium]
MKKEPLVAIIILNWNGFADSVECLTSLRNCTFKNYKIVLVDNGSTNTESYRLKEMFPEAHLICNKINRGFAGGNNDGMNWALENGYEYIVNLNNDCLVEKDWLSKFIEGITKAQADFASSRIMYYPEKHLICSDGDALLLDGTGVIVNHLKTQAESGKIQPIFSACGAGAIYSASCLEKIKIHGNQFYDELYFAYFEDVDLGIRLNAKACKGILVPDAVVYHKGAQSAGFHSFFQIFHTEKNRILNELLNYPLWLIPAGELYYILRTVVSISKKIMRPAKKQTRNVQQTETYSSLSVIIKSRLWILSNFSKIWKDRQERKARGLINKKIYKHFYRDFPTLLKTKK